MILADENIDVHLIEALRLKDYEVYSVRENHPGLKDQEVVNLSKQPPRIILTEDKDFGEWVYAHRENNISVILLRYRSWELEEIRSLLLDLLDEKGKQLFGKFTTITTNKIRIRSTS